MRKNGGFWRAQFCTEVARPESVAPVNFARESNDLQVWQRAMLDETLDVLLDVF
jgi:hypothetical protein